MEITLTATNNQGHEFNYVTTIFLNEGGLNGVVTCYPPKDIGPAYSVGCIIIEDGSINDVKRYTSNFIAADMIATNREI